MLFVAGTSGRPFSGPDFATVAYDATSGRRIWSALFASKGDGQDYAFEVEVSPDGSTVFVAGPSQGAKSYDYVSIAYDASDGEVIWKRRFDGGHFDYPSSLAVSPDGGMIFLTGRSTKPGQRSDYLTLGQATRDGDVIWHERYDGPSHSGERAHALVVSPDSSSVFVTGVSKSTDTGPDFATVAYRASTGASLWTRRFNGPGTDSARDLSMSPSGEVVFVTGHTYSGSDTGRDYATFAYSTINGDVLWTKRYNGKRNGSDTGLHSSVNPNGSTLFVTGYSQQGGADFLTIAYDVSDGTWMWTRRYDGPSASTDFPVSVVVSPDGSSVFVTGVSASLATNFDFATVAYDAGTGDRAWASRYAGPGLYDRPSAMVASPDGSKVFVTGESEDIHEVRESATVAYAT